MTQPTMFYRVVLGEHHRPTGFTYHTKNGMPLEAPSELRIVQFPNDPGWYLFYCDPTGKEFTDTYHDTLDSAFEQALAEFGVGQNEWQLA
ncbi:MAG: hypothetical protein SNJ75_02805 [Gemmataceae bacterium]